MTTRILGPVTWILCSLTFSCCYLVFVAVCVEVTERRFLDLGMLSQDRLRSGYHMIVS